MTASYALRRGRLEAAGAVGARAPGSSPRASAGRPRAPQGRGGGQGPASVARGGGLGAASRRTSPTTACRAPARAAPRGDRHACMSPAGSSATACREGGGLRGRGKKRTPRPLSSTAGPRRGTRGRRATGGVTGRHTGAGPAPSGTTGGARPRATAAPPAGLRRQRARRRRRRPCATGPRPSRAPVAAAATSGA